VDGYDIRVGMTAFGSPGFGWSTNDFYYDNEHLQTTLSNNPLIKRNVTSYTDGLQAAIDMIESRSGSNKNRPCKIIFVSDSFPSDIDGNAGVSPGQPGIYDGTNEAQLLRDMDVDVIPLAIYLPKDMTAGQLAKADAFFRNISFDRTTYFTASDSFEFQEVWGHIITRELFLIDTVITDTLSEDFTFLIGVAASDIVVSAGTAELNANTGVVTWDLTGAASWEVHTLIIQIKLKPAALTRSGSLPTNSRITSSAENIDAGPEDTPSGSPFLVRDITVDFDYELFEATSENVILRGEWEEESSGYVIFWVSYDGAPITQDHFESLSFTCARALRWEGAKRTLHSSGKAILTGEIDGNFAQVIVPVEVNAAGVSSVAVDVEGTMLATGYVITPGDVAENYGLVNAADLGTISRVVNNIPGTSFPGKGLENNFDFEMMDMDKDGTLINAADIGALSRIVNQLTYILNVQN